MRRNTRTRQSARHCFMIICEGRKRVFFSMQPVCVLCSFDAQNIAQVAAEGHFEEQACRFHISRCLSALVNASIGQSLSLRLPF